MQEELIGSFRQSGLPQLLEALRSFSELDQKPDRGLLEAIADGLEANLQQGDAEPSALSQCLGLLAGSLLISLKSRCLSFLSHMEESRMATLARLNLSFWGVLLRLQNCTLIPQFLVQGSGTSRLQSFWTELPTTSHLASTCADPKTSQGKE